MTFLKAQAHIKTILRFSLYRLTSHLILSNTNPNIIKALSCLVTTKVYLQNRVPKTQQAHMSVVVVATRHDSHTEV